MAFDHFELTKQAAKAYGGYDLLQNRDGIFSLWKDGVFVQYWNPKDDNDHSFKLMVKCDIEPYQTEEDGWHVAYAGYYTQGYDRQQFVCRSVPMTENHEANVRLVILQAAGEQGKRIK